MNESGSTNPVYKLAKDDIQWGIDNYPKGLKEGRQRINVLKSAGVDKYQFQDAI